MFGMVTNSRSVGGFRGIIGRDVIFDDGVFEVTLIKTPRNPIELNEIVAALVIRQIDSKHMYSFKSSCVKFTSFEEIPWTLDGEFGGEHDEVLVQNKKQGLQIMIKESTKQHFEEKKEALQSAMEEADIEEMVGIEELEPENTVDEK